MSVDKHLLNSQYKRPLCHTTWESSDLGGTSALEVVDIKQRVRAVGSCVPWHREAFTLKYRGSMATPVSSSTNRAGCFQELQGHFCEGKIYMCWFSLRYC